MFNPAYLMLSRHSVYYFRWPVPLQFSVSSKRLYVKFSLETKERKEALYLARLLEYRISMLIKQGGMRYMNASEIKEAVRSYCQNMLEVKKRSIRQNGALSGKELELYQSAPARYAKLEEADIEIDDSVSMAHVINMMNLNICEGSVDYEKLRRIYKQAIPAFCKEVLRYNHEQVDFDFTPQPAPAYSMQDAPQKPQYQLSSMIDKYVAAHVNDGVWDDNTKNKNHAMLIIVQELLGAGFLVGDMNLDKAKEVRDALKQVPVNRNRSALVRGLPLHEAMQVEAAKKISLETFDKYLNCCRSLFEWCQNEGYITENVFTKVKGRIGKKRKSENPRLPFTAQQIRQIRDAVINGIEGVEHRHYRYWGTLIGMYTGARVNEVSQIMLDDIRHNEEGIWHFYMNDDGDDGKKLKTDAARRFVPIHKELLKLGIIEEAEKLRKQGMKRFLHEATYCKKNGYGKKLGQFFNETFLVKLGIKKPGLVFHSFRHTAITRLYQAGVPQPIVETIVGHERSGVSQSTYFKEGYKLSQLKEAMDKFDPTKDA